MFRTRILVAGAVLALATGALTGCGKSDDSSDSSSAPSGAAPATSMPMTHGDPSSEPAFKPSTTLMNQLAGARDATVKYVSDLRQAQADGYMIITQHLPGMGYHYLNPNVKDFDVNKPAILVYEKRANGFQLAALEWVWPTKPATPPLEGATYGSFAAACHYKDGTFIPKSAEADCAKTNPDGGSAFNFWHPDLVTMHVWLWHDNPAGLYHGTNPLIEGYTA